MALHHYNSLGDWLVRDGAAHWRIVSDQPTTLEQRVHEPS